jgi:hypothetical protein
MRRRLKTCATDEQVVAQVFNLCMVHRRLPTCGYVLDVASPISNSSVGAGWQPAPGSETGLDGPQVENLRYRRAGGSTGF